MFAKSQIGLDLVRNTGEQLHLYNIELPCPYPSLMGIEASVPEPLHLAAPGWLEHIDLAAEMSAENQTGLDLVQTAGEQLCLCLLLELRCSGIGFSIWRACVQIMP